MGYRSGFRVGAAFLAALIAAATIGTAQTPQSPPATANDQQPVFREGTERIVIDAAVVDKEGAPVSGLTANDFTLTIDGVPRRVLSAEFVSQSPTGTSGTAQPATDQRPAFSSNAQAVGGRLVLLVFDLEGIATGGGRDVAKAAAEFVSLLSPGDHVGLMSFPNGPSAEFTGDRARVAAVLEKIIGRGTSLPMNIYTVGVQEAFDIDSGNNFALTRAIDRECVSARVGEVRPPRQSQGGGLADVCPQEISRLAHEIVLTYRRRVDEVSRVFRTLLEQLKPIDTPKTVVWVSEGLPMPLDSQADLGQLSALAAAARVTLYAIHLDRNSGFDASNAKPSPTAMEDRGAGRLGLDLLAGVSRGAVFASVGTGDNAFTRIAREMTAYYLLSAEPEPKDRDGRTHKIKVTLARPGLTVRARRDFAVAADRDEAVTLEQSVANVLGAPLLATELPMKVATYNMRVPEGLRLVISTEIGHDATAPEKAAIGFSVTDGKGKVVSTGFREATMTPVTPGEPGPLEATSVATVEPGTYTLKIAIVDSQGRRGSVEHPFTARLTRVGSIEVADLVLTPSATKGQTAVRIVADTTIDGEPFSGYLELYGGVDTNHPPAVTIDVSDSEAGTALGTQSGRLTAGKEKDRFIVDAPLPIGLLPPGNYVARATVTADGASSRLVRPFTLARAVPPGDVFKTDLEKQVGAFRPDQILTASLVGRALDSASEISESASSEATIAAETIAAGNLSALDTLAIPEADRSLLGSFLRGLALYRKGALEDAAAEFRAAVRSSPDFLAGILYLGACYASGGRTKEAVGAWQTSLIADDASPEIFALVADGYLRMGDVEAATDVLVEAGTKWPQDERFIVRSALARAAAGHPDDALTALSPALEEAADPALLTLAARLAIADVARRPVAEQRDQLSKLQDLESRIRAGHGEVPPALARWITYLQSPQTGDSSKL
jgi:VWFA-related protein